MVEYTMGPLSHTKFGHDRRSTGAHKIPKFGKKSRYIPHTQQRTISWRLVNFLLASSTERLNGFDLSSKMLRIPDNYYRGDGSCNVTEGPKPLQYRCPIAIGPGFTSPNCYRGTEHRSCNRLSPISLCSFTETRSTSNYFLVLLLRRPFTVYGPFSRSYGRASRLEFPNRRRHRRLYSATTTSAAAVTGDDAVGGRLTTTMRDNTVVVVHRGRNDA